MTGRGALIKPWIFMEYKTGKTWEPTAEERVSVYRKLVGYFKERFGDDEKGKRGAFYFLPWHFNWFYRYRPLSSDLFEETSKEYPLIQDSRKVDNILECESLSSSLSPLEQLLRNPNENAHFDIASSLWEADSDEDAIEKLKQLAEEKLELYEKDTLQKERDKSEQTKVENTGKISPLSNALNDNDKNKEDKEIASTSEQTREEIEVKGKPSKGIQKGSRRRMFTGEGIREHELDEIRG